MNEEKEQKKPGLIFSAMVKVMRGVEAIGKDRKNQQQGFVYRGIDDVYNDLHNLLADAGIVTIPCVVSDKAEERVTKTGGNLIYRILTMEYAFYAEDGSSILARVIGEAMDSGDKASNKAMAVAHKYALLQTFCVPTADTDPANPKDPDGTAYPPSTKKARTEKAPEKDKAPKAAKETPAARTEPAATTVPATDKPAQPPAPPKHIALVLNSPKHAPIIKTYMTMRSVDKKTMGGELFKLWEASKHEESSYLNAVEKYCTVPAPESDDNVPF